MVPLAVERQAGKLHFPEEWVRSPRAFVGLLALTAACFLPFLNKAFHIDDPVFLLAARHLLDHPFDPYGFSTNWEGTVQPASTFFFHGPLNAYFLAALCAVLGWSESASHAGFLLPTMLGIAATYGIARHLSPHPIFATLFTLFTPAFIVSNSNLMSENWFFALWTLSIAAWLQSIDQNSSRWAILGAVCVTGCVLTRYNGIALVPLLGLYSFLCRANHRSQMLYLLIPILVFFTYQFVFHQLYGTIPFLAASTFAEKTRTSIPLASRAISTLVYAGGAHLGIVLFLPLMVSRIKALVVWLLVGVTAITLTGLFRDFPAFISDRFILFQYWFFFLVGTGILFLLFTDAYRSRTSPKALFLTLWIGGIFVFSLVNWTINVRSLLPLTPAIGILLTRAFRPVAHSVQEPEFLRHPLPPVLVSALLGLAVAYSDFQMANSVRTVSEQIVGRFPTDRIWFQGHWGLQYYLEARGARPIDYSASRLEPGDVVVLPENATGYQLLPEIGLTRLAEIDVSTPNIVATMNRRLGAGFYVSTVKRPLPIAFGWKSSERFTIYRIVVPIDFKK